MYRTKKDVDKHVQDINSKIRNASDRNLKGYSIAKLYHQVGDYENARRYVTNYLSEKDTSTIAHKLLGQIYESLKQKEKAVGSYKKAFELDNSQKDLVLKICELLVDLPIDPQRAKYWVETGEKHHPHHDSVYRLREAMLTSVEGDTSPKLEEVLAAELVAKPTDVILRMRLVRLFQRSGRIQEGWEHVTQVENMMPWPENKDWYSCIAELAENFQLQFRTKCGHEFYIEYISCLDRLMDLEFRAGATASAAAEILHKLDQVLHLADQLPASGQPQAWPALMAHFRGQLYLHAATLLFRRSQKEVSAWKENSKFAGALLLAGWGIRELEAEKNDGRRKHYWKGSGSSRRSQAGHILLGMSGKQGPSVYQERLAGLATTNTQDKIYNAVFVSRDQRAGSATSCLASNQAFVELVARTSLPSLSDLASSDEAMAALKPDDLHHLVWVGLRYYRPGKVLELGFRLPGFDGLSQEGGKDPLSQLDMDAFLYATVYVTGWQVEKEPSAQDVPAALPVAITAPLATEAQEELWRVAIKSSKDGLQPQERRVLQHGLDTIRAVGLHGLDLHLSMKLAKTFECHALEAKVIADCDEHVSRGVAVLETRAATYYKCALSTIDKQDRGMGGRQPSVRLFSPAGEEPNSSEVTKMKEGAKFFLACQKMHQDLNEEALTAFGELRTPYASFYTAEIYKKLAAEELNNRPGQIQGGVSGRYGSLLHEAQEALYRTLDRLKAPGEAASHPLNQQLPECIEEVENLLAGVGVNGEEEATPIGTPRRVLGVTRLEEELTSTPNMARSLFGNQNSSYVNSPSRTEARPSPERLDAQVRNLAATQEGVMKTLVEQNAVFVESNKAMLEELRNLNVEITKLRKSSEANEVEIRTLRQSSESAAIKAAEATAAAAKAAEASAAALVANASTQSTASSVAAATAAANMQAVNMHQQLNNMQAQAAVSSMENYQFTEEEQQLLDSFGYCTSMQQQYGMYGQMSPFAQQMYTGAQMSQQQQLAKAVAMRSAQQQVQQQQVQQQQQAAYAGMYSPQTWTGSPVQQQPQANLQLPTVPTSVTPNSFSQHLSTQQKNTLFSQMGSKPSQTGTPSNTPQEGTSLVATPLASGQVTPTQAVSKPATVTFAKTAVPAANVVITKSDKIPTTAAPTTVTMSVTVPPQHRLGTTPRPTPTTQLLTTPTLAQSPATPISAYKTPAGQINALTGTPHGFQIPMPDGVSPLTVSPFPPESGNACPITTTALLSTIAPPAFSAVTPSPDKSTSSASKLRNPSGGGTPTLKQRQPSAGDDGEEEEYEPDVNFKPVIPLPEIVDVVTGEEDEAVLFEERSKLFRYAEDTKEWKERGLGQAKLLHNKVTGNVRFIMRREQTFKICANHNIVPEMKMDQMKGNAKARIWGADDFADEDRKTETFCIRFKTEEQAEEFNVKFEMAKTMTKIAKEKSPPTTTKKPETDAKSSTLAQIAAKQKSSSWECSACLVRNDMAKIQCMSCESAKPGHEEEVKKLQDAAKPAAPVMTIGEGGGFKFAPAGGAAAPASSGFVFGTPEKPKSDAPSTGGFSFGTPKAAAGGFSFAPTPTGAVTPTKENASKWSFGSPEKKEFAFSGIKPTSPRKHLNSVVSETEEDDGLYKDDDEGDNLYFDPVIPLPDKVEVKTGEEDEEVLYSHRAKLYRYIDNEWKERGVGDVKILKNNASKKIRLLMRRDQVLKICLNHYATAQLVSTFKEKDTKSWTWAAQDFSEGELTTMTFALRFKSPEITKEFKDTLDLAVQGTETTPVVIAKEASPAVSVSGSEKEKSKTPSAVEEEVVLFDVADYSPPEHVDNEEEVSFHGQGLKLNTEEDAAEVAAKISSTPTMHVLTLSGNTVGINAAKAIGKSLEGHTEFRRAQWKDMFTGRMKTEIPPALIHLSNGIMTAKARLVELDLSDNAFGPIGMEGIKTLLASPSCFSLKILKLNNTGCGVTGGKALAKTLLECYHKSKEIGHPLALEVFVLGRSRQENEGGKALAEVFKLMGSLKEVTMPQNGIYHDGLTALADAFSNNPNLRHLDMNDNTFTEKGARPMAKALAKLKNLEYLNLGDCLLRSAGVTLIARALKNNHPKLKELILDSNEIRTKGVMEVIEAIADKDHLEKLSVDVNQLGDDGVAKMRKRLTEIGKLDVLGELEENQDPDSDEEDPDLEDDLETEAATATSKSDVVVSETTSAAKSTFTFNTPSSKTGMTTAQTASALFGGSPSTSIFGGNASQSSNIFGGSPSSTFKPSGNLFGASPSKESIFGNSTVNSTVADSSTEKSETEERKTSFLFGGAGGKLAAAAASPSIFAAGVTSSPGNSLFGSQPAAAQEPSSTTTSSSIFGSGSSSTTTSSSSSIFGSGSKANFSFSSFGSTATAEPSGLVKASEDFKFKGAGAAVFGSKATPKKDGDESDGEDAEEDAHDPHFEPIVPLPELVTVTTGEEDEEVVFKHRAKVYRFDSDTKQWKERGVGDIKILKHPQTLKYRVLLRRDQIHKIAVNHLILADIELKPMSGSETAWCWFAMDFSEDEVNGIAEQLAVRFKHADTAKEFKAKFMECQEEIQSRQNLNASGVTVERAVLSPSKKQEDENDAEEEEDAEGDDEEDEYGDDDYNDGETIMFQQQAFLSQKDDKTGEWVGLGDVDLRILYDDDVYGARIVAEGPSGTEEDDATVCNHLIAMQTNLSDDLTWSALDFSIDPPNYRTFKAQFESDEATSEFRDMFAEGKDLAEQSEILEQPGGIEGDPQDFYYGVGGDHDGQDS